MKRIVRPAHLPDRPGIVELERHLDPLLRCRAADEASNLRLKTTLRSWSAGVWDTAELLGPSLPTASEVHRGVGLSQRPVFVCGAARSGTTLMRDLLDGHPHLAVVPTESIFYTHLERALFGLTPDRHCRYIGTRWLELLVAPPPYWLLGRSAHGKSPNVMFARRFAGWWQIPDRQAGARTPSWPLAALALACAQQLGGGRLPPTAARWVEKTPCSEHFLWRIWRDFPAAKVIHLVRRPEAVLASIKAMRPDAWNRRGALAHVVRRMARSYRIAAEGAAQWPRERYRLVRYEDLTADPDATMREIATFLEIDHLPSLLQPSVAGLPAANNTSFGKTRPDLHRALDPVERGLLALAGGRAAAKLGYGPGLSAIPEHRIVGHPTQ